MNQKQRNKLKTIYRKLGSAKTKYLSEKIRNSKKEISQQQIQEALNMNSY